VDRQSAREQRRNAGALTVARKVPWVVYPADDRPQAHANALAKALLLQTGSAAGAHRAIARNRGVLKRPKRNVDDTVLLLWARSIQLKEKCQGSYALLRVARERTTNPDAEATLLKRLKRTLKGESLAKFASRYPECALPALSDK
jgi:hypothetical protein